MNGAVIGVGNRFRRDDGVGPAVVAALGRKRLPGVRLVTELGEPTALLDAWAGLDLAVIVDAMRCQRPRPGRVHRVAGLPNLALSSGIDTHGLGVAAALHLGAVLERLPRRFVVYAVEAADLGPGEGLSPRVAAAVPRIARLVRAELGDAGGQWVCKQRPSALPQRAVPPLSRGPAQARVESPQPTTKAKR